MRIARRNGGHMDLLDLIRYLGALALVLALVGCAAIFVRRYGLPGVVAGKGRRLAIVESLMLGKNYRLAIVKCDGQEHLLALGPQGATLIDKAISPEPVFVVPPITNLPAAEAAQSEAA